MNIKLYSMKNTKVGIFEIPHAQNILPEDYIEELRNQVILGKLSADRVRDTELYCLGEFDNHTGQIRLLSEPLKIGSFNDLITTVTEA